MQNYSDFLATGIKIPAQNVKFLRTDVSPVGASMN
jgi:hypothetical protein